MILDESTFLLYAARSYYNPSCSGVEEFEEDLRRFQYVRKLFNRYRQTGELKVRLIQNHLIVLHNTFDDDVANMLFMRLEGFHDCLKPFLQNMKRLPVMITYNSRMIDTRLIDSDETITMCLEHRETV
ncbi:MAG: hypothetical protein WCY93_08565 [Anaerolineaceae bacterium]